MNVYLTEECLNQIKGLLRLRNDNAIIQSLQQQTEDEILFNEIPALTPQQISAIFMEFNETKDFSKALNNNGYRYTFNLGIITKLLEKYPSNQNTESFFLVIFLNQLLSCIFYENVMTNEIYSIFMKAFNNCVDTKESKQLCNGFYLLYHTARVTESFKWNDECIGSTIQHFRSNKSLESIYYSTLMDFIREICYNSESNVLELLYYLLKNNHKIMRVKDLNDLISYIEPTCLRLVTNSLLILSYISNIGPLTAVNGLIKQLPKAVLKRIQSSYDDVFHFGQLNQISEYPSTYEGTIPSNQYDYYPNETFNNIFPSLPLELGISAEELFEKVPDEAKSVLNVLCNFLNSNIKPACLSVFYQGIEESLNEYQGIEMYNLISGFLWLCNKYEIKSVIQFLYPILKSKFFFNIESTIYGPQSLDPTINLFRSAIITVFNARDTNKLYELLENFKNNPFLFAELLGRYLSQDVKLHRFVIRSTSSGSSKVSPLLNNHAYQLQFMKAGVEARTPYFLFVYAMFRDNKSRLECLKDEAFIGGLCRFVCEKGLSESLVKIITNSMTYIADESLEHTVANLYKTAITCSELSIGNLIYNSVSRTLHQKPSLINVFCRFLEPMMNELNRDHSPQMLANILTFLMHLSNYELPEYHLQVLTQVIQPGEQILKNLFEILGGTMKRPFIVKNPSITPLMLIVFGRTKYIDQIIAQLTALAQFSQYNARSFHDHDVDLILLDLIKTKGQVSYKGVHFMLEIEESLVLPLLFTICESKSNYRVATRLGSIATEGRYTYELAKIMIHNSMKPIPNYPIGTIEQICEVTGFSINTFLETFTITFWLDFDLSMLTSSTVSIYLVRFTDKNDNTFGISLQNGSICAYFERGQLRTVVNVCPRITKSGPCQYTFMFINKPSAGKMLITTLRDNERLHDSEFCQIKFEKGPVTMRIGGYSYERRKTDFLGSQFGIIGNLCIYPKPLMIDQIFKMLGNSPSLSSGYLFSLHDPPVVTKTKLNLKNTFQNIIPGTNTPLNTTILTRAPTMMTLLDCMQDEKIIRNLVNAFKKYDGSDESRKFVDSLLSILAIIMKSSKDQTLSARFALIIQNFQLDFKFYKCLDSIMNSIVDKQVRLTWFEDLILNANIWKKSVDYSRIIIHWSTKLIDNQEEFFKERSYFTYFLTHFYDHPYYHMLLKRVAFLHLEEKDVSNFVSFIYNNQNRTVLLEIARDITNPIINSKFKRFDCFFEFMRTDNLSVAVQTILILHQLYKNNFHMQVVVIMNLTSVNHSLLVELEKYVGRFPNLLSLTCAIALKLNEPINVIPDHVTTSALWYFWPLLKSLQSNTEELQSFVCQNITHKDMGMILDFALFLSVYVENKKPDNNPYHFILHNICSSTMTYSPNIINLLDRAFSAIFFHIDSTNYSMRMMNEMNKYGINISQIRQTNLAHYTISNPDSLRKIIDQPFTDKFLFEFRNTEEDMILINDVQALFVKFSESKVSSEKINIRNKDEIKLIIDHFQLRASDQQDENSMEKISNCYKTIFPYYKEFRQDSFNENYTKIWNEVKKMMEDITIPEISANYQKIPVLAEFIDPKDPILFKRDRNLCFREAPFTMKRVKPKTKRNSKIEETKFVSNATLLTITKTVPIYWSYENGMTILKTPSRVIALPEITRIMKHEQGIVEIFTRFGRSYYIQFNDNAQAFLNIFQNKLAKKVHGESPIPNEELIKYQNSWKNNAISTFTYINLCNYFSGRTYNDIMKYPVFPSVSFNGEIKFDLLKYPANNRALNNGESIDDEPIEFQDQLLVLPENYYLFESCKDHDFIYSNKVALESSPIIAEWIGKVFSNIDVVPYRLFESTYKHPVKQLKPISPFTAFGTFEEDNINYKSRTLYKCFSFERHICLVFQDGQIDYFKLTFNTEKPYQIVSSYNVDIKDAQFFKLENGIIVYKPGSVIQVGLTDKTEYSYYYEEPLFAGNVFDPVCQVTPSVISLDKTRKKEAKLREKIKCMVASSEYNTIVCGCYDCKLRIRSLRSGRKRATIDLENKLPQDIIITKNLGLIVVYTDKNIFVLSINGTILKKCENPKKIKEWFTFSSILNVDYIGFESQDHILYHFEAYYPEKMEQISGVSGNIIGYQYDWAHDCQIFVDSNKFIKMICAKGVTNDDSPTTQ